MVIVIKKYLLNKKVLRLGITITGLALIVIGFITFYGSNVGNFVMSIDDELSERRVFMGTTADFVEKEGQTSLAALPVTGARDIAYIDLNIVDACLADADYDDPLHKYVAYSFYIKNFGIQNSDVKYEISLTNIKANVDNAIRIMTVVSEDPVNDKAELERIKKLYTDEQDALADKDLEDYLEGKQTIYKAPDKGIPLEKNEKEFLGKTKVCDEVVRNFKDGKMLKFTIILWLEGNDPDTTNDILGGKVKIKMNFSVVKKPNIDEEKE